ncbi:MAG: hypothetical protein RLZZ241_1317 [Bacteroidota bacterium]|jgi:hypothetical protein
MKRAAVLSLIMSIMLSGLSLNAQEQPMATDSVLRHIVLFSFKPDTSPEALKRVETAFANLQDKIPEIKGFEWGLNNSPEGLNKGFTHCYTLTFSSEADLAVYLPHPDHKAFGTILAPYLKDVLVVDYWAME